jgi:hypothetical protein
VVEVEGLPMDLPVSTLMLVCPITAAWILVRRDEGPGGMRRLMKRVFDYRKITRRIWYVPMILLMPIALLLTYWVMRLTGVASPEPSTALAEVPILVVAYFIAAVGEEAGWTGYAVDPMQGRWSALGTGLIMGSIWRVWHIVPYVQVNHPAVWVIGQTLGAIPLRGPHRLALQQHREKHVRRHRPSRDEQRERVHLPGLQFPLRPRRPGRDPCDRSRDRHHVVGLQDLGPIQPGPAHPAKESPFGTLEVRAIEVTTWLVRAKNPSTPPQVMEGELCGREQSVSSRWQEGQGSGSLSSAT